MAFDTDIGLAAYTASSTCGRGADEDDGAGTRQAQGDRELHPARRDRDRHDQASFADPVHSGRVGEKAALRRLGQPIDMARAACCSPATRPISSPATGWWPTAD